MIKRALSASLAVFAVALGASFGWAKWRLQDQNPPTGRILSVGNPEHAEQLLRELLRDLAANNYDWSAIPLERQRLPDQIYSEKIEQRSNNVYCLSQASLHVYKDEVALYTDLYTEYDFEYLGGDSGRQTIRGFFLVGWKDGTVNRVPQEEVRWFRVTMPDGLNTRVPVFPGMRVYGQAEQRLK